MQVTRGKIEKAQKVVIYGPEGIGKSTFAAQFPDPLFIDTEDSTVHMDVARTQRPSSWAMLMDQVRYVRDHVDICKTLIIDTADWAEQLCITSICASSKPPKAGIEDFGYGKGYVYLVEEFGKLLNLLQEVIDRGIHIVLTAHAAMRRVELPEETGSYDRWELKLQKKTAPLVKEWADMLLFANYKIYVVNVDNQGAQKGKNKAQGGARVMYTTHHVSWDAKNRCGLPDELPFEYKKIAHCIPDIGKLISSPVATFTSEPMLEPPAPSIPSEPVEFPKLPEQPTAHQNASTLPRALLDLMEASGVAEDDIQEVVAQRGYYPRDMPISKYDQGFIEGVLIAAWAQVHEMIQTNRKPTPF